MTNKILFFLFWTAFAGLFLLFFSPVVGYVLHGYPEYLSVNTTAKKLLFPTHIVSGILVYITAFLQFTPSIRNKHIAFHRMSGKIYVAAALVCIVSLYYLITLGRYAGLPFWPSQYTATSLWLLFIVLALYFVRQGKILWHRRFMISGFICAAYFVTVRVVDHYCMAFFHSIFKPESTALFISDLFVWLMPLLICWSYWLLLPRRSNKMQVVANNIA